MQWTLTVSRQVAKQIELLPLSARRGLITLMREIEVAGPVIMVPWEKTAITAISRRGIQHMWSFGKGWISLQK